MYHKPLSSIKNILFDLGGVIIPINQELTFQSFASKCGWDIENVKVFFKKNDFLKNYENGTLSTEEFLNTIEQHLLLSRHEIIDSWNKLLLEIPHSRIELLKKLKQRYRIYLLSNTNDLHIYAINNQLKTRNLQPLEQIFNKVYYSYKIKYSKPSVDAYQYVLRDAQMNPLETLFLDDSKENTEGAIKAGINSIHIDSTSNLETLFNDL